MEASGLSARTPTQARGRKRVVEIRRAAIGLLGRRDVAAITVADIAREAGLGVGTFYHYYPTKEALLLELRASLFAESAAELGAVFTEPMHTTPAFLDALAQLTKGWIKMAGHHPGLERAIMSLSIENPQVATALREQEAPLRTLATALIQKYAKVLRPCDPAHVATTIMLLIEAVVIRTVCDPELTRDSDWLVAEAVEMVGHHLIPDPLFVASGEAGVDPE